MKVHRLICVMILGLMIPTGRVEAHKMDMIHSVSFEGIAEEDRASMISLLGLETGKMLDPGKIRRGFQAAAASGRIRWIRLEKIPGPEGVDLILKVEIQPRLAEIRIIAPGKRWPLMIRRQLNLRSGDPVDVARIEMITARIRRKIIDSGYPEARLDSYLDYSSRTNSVDLRMILEPGPPRILDRVSFEGLPPGIESEEVMPGFKQGRKLKKRKLLAMETRVEKHLRSLGYWDAVITRVDMVGPLEEIEVRMILDPGPKYRLEIEAEEPLLPEIEKAVPDPAVEDLNPVQLENLEERIRENLRLRGFPLVQLTATISGKDEKVLHLEVDLGPHARLREIVFPGSSGIPATELEDILPVRRGFGSRRHPLTREVLAMAIESLRRYYHQNGYADVEIGVPILERINPDEEPGKKTALRLKIEIQEGLRWNIASFDLRGFPAEALWVLDVDSYRMELSEAWDPKRLERIRKDLAKALADSGYPEGRVRADIRTEKAPGVDVILWAEPGRYTTFGEIVVAGLTRTSESVIRRVLDACGLIQGRPYLASTLARARQDLYRLGLFRSVTIGSIPGQELLEERGIVVELDEGLQRSYLLGFGWGTDEGVRMTLGWSHINLFGGAHAVSLETRYSSLEFRYQLSLREPTLPVLNTPGYMALYRTEESYSDYEQRREGVWMEIGDRFRAPFRHWLRYEYQVVNPKAPEDVLSRLERDQQRIHISSITPVFEIDRRNDPLNPSRGYLITTALEWAFPAFGSDTEFLKLRAGGSYYHPVPGGKVSVGMRIGTISLLDRVPEIPENFQIPLAVRFFAGGSTTHRAFKRDHLGIPGQTIDDQGRAVGGNAVVLLNMEYQHRIFKSLAGAIFLDGGNVWADPGKIRWGDFRWGLGVGLRFETPAGPFRMEYGHKLDRMKHESSGEFFVSFGTAF